MGVEVKFHLFQSSGTSASQNGAPDNEKFCHLPQLKPGQLPQNFVPINKMKFLDILMKIVIGAAIFKTVKFTLMYNTFRLLPINDHDMNRSSTEIYFH
jgi:hypothetical protein